MEPFVIEEKEDHVICSRSPATEKEEWELEIALRRVGARMVDEMVKKLIENGHTEAITYREMKKAFRQLKKNKVSDDNLYVQLITKDGLKIYGPGRMEDLYKQWAEDIDGKFQEI